MVSWLFFPLSWNCGMSASEYRYFLKKTSGNAEAATGRRQTEIRCPVLSAFWASRLPFVLLLISFWSEKSNQIFLPGHLYLLLWGVCGGERVAGRFGLLMEENISCVMCRMWLGDPRSGRAPTRAGVTSWWPHYPNIQNELPNYAIIR